MKKLFKTFLASLALLCLVSAPAFAQYPRSPWDAPTQTLEVRTQTPAYNVTLRPLSQVPVNLSPGDPDQTGYPFINNWKGNLVRDPRVFLTDRERQNMTQARVDLVAALAPVFLRHQNALRSVLTPLQDYIFENIVANQDMEKLAAMSEDEANGYVAMLAQQLRLDGGQTDLLRQEVRNLRADIAPLQSQYAARFDQEIATAEQRVIAERAARTTISTSPLEK